MELAAREPAVPAGLVQPRDQPALLRSYPTELDARFPASGSQQVLLRHPGLDHPDQLGDDRIHQGRRGPPPGWVATDISGRLYTATVADHAVSDEQAPVELGVFCADTMSRWTNRTEDASTATDVPKSAEAHGSLTRQQQPESLAFAESTTQSTASKQPDWAGLPSHRRLISVGGWPEPESLQVNQQLDRQQEVDRRRTGPRKQQLQRRRRHTGFFMSPSGYCHTRGAFYKLTTPLDQDCWTCCGQTTKTAPGCVG